LPFLAGPIPPAERAPSTLSAPFPEVSNVKFENSVHSIPGEPVAVAATAFSFEKDIETVLSAAENADPLRTETLSSSMARFEF
jgi:hypothetical protein